MSHCTECPGWCTETGTGVDSHGDPYPYPVQAECLGCGHEQELDALQATLEAVTQERDEACISRDCNARTIDRMAREHSLEIETLCAAGTNVTQERDTLRTALREAREALGLVPLLQGHSHYDPTMRQMAGCLRCVTEREIMEKAQSALGRLTALEEEPA